MFLRLTSEAKSEAVEVDEQYEVSVVVSAFIYIIHFKFKTNKAIRTGHIDTIKFFLQLISTKVTMHSTLTIPYMCMYIWITVQFNGFL